MRPAQGQGEIDCASLDELRPFGVQARTRDTLLTGSTVELLRVPFDCPLVNRSALRKPFAPH